MEPAGKKYLLVGIYRIFQSLPHPVLLPAPALVECAGSICSLNLRENEAKVRWEKVAEGRMRERN
ncbi:MAG: hypothetical protein A3K46_01575 [Chloroflexi bacterium RBG_13_60_9]|nr:MAG: hypothetical protein A3K46_01575 [Chloroflexi bacterium RBG_13_60_9]